MASPTIVIFGASGDLTRRKLVPALAKIDRDGEHTLRVLGVARSKMSDDEFRAHLSEEDELGAFAERVHYHAADVTKRDQVEGLAARLKELDGGGDRLFYFSTGPSVFAPGTEALDACGLLDEEQGFSRVVYEKPFGHDLESAREYIESHSP